MTPEQARHYAWLLRGDVREATGAQQAPNEAFEGWWLVQGRQAYPACAGLSDAQIAWLREPVGKLAIGDLELAVPRALQWSLRWRPDVRKAFGAEPAAMAAWFYATGLAELRLEALVSPAWVRELDRPLRRPPGKGTAPAEGPGSRSAADAPSAVPAPTLLMALAWHLLPAAQRAAMPLDDPAGRLRFMARFFIGVGRSVPLQALLAPRWRAWLLQALPQPEAAPSGRGAAGVEALPQAEGLRRRCTIIGVPVAAWMQAPPRAQVLPDATAQPPAEAHWRERPFGVNLFGFAFGELGIGEDVRMAVLACEAAGIPFRVVNVDPGASLRQADRMLAGHVEGAADAAPFAFNVFCMPGFDMVGRLLMRDGLAVLRGHHNIGWWPWELPVWPRRWRSAFDFVDEIWAATHYARETYAASCPKPVSHVPLAATVDRLQPMSRRALGLPARRFLFLFVFDFNSHLPRKNPLAVLRAFRQAFPADDRSVGLVLKTMNARQGDAAWEAFRAECAQDPRILLLTDTMDRATVLALMAACDAYVSLHRAEGFGRTLAEALLLGKPVVATDFSGNVDFLRPRLGFPVKWARRALAPGDYPFVEPDDAPWWAEPDVGHAAQRLRAAREAAANPAFAERVRRHAQRQFAPLRVGTLMRERLEALWREASSTPLAAAASHEADQARQAAR